MKRLIGVLAIWPAVALADGPPPRPMAYAFRLVANPTDPPIVDVEGKMGIGESKETRFSYDGKSWLAVVRSEKRYSPNGASTSPRYDLTIYRGDKADRTTRVSNFIFPYPDGSRRFECGVGADSGFKPIMAVGLALEGSAREACKQMWRESSTGLPH